MEFTIVPPDVDSVKVGDLEIGTVFNTKECPECVLMISDSGILKDKLDYRVIPVYNLKTLTWGVCNKNHPVKDILGTDRKSVV